ncbi:hypothetical protein R1sor_024509 [Riccia sorocarpa]|uniref:Uncharacterized protein n=1 Tax=Riccia sorocarpa TaxID=122646 RepID=A0ABD3GQW2_9MARC
MGLAIPVAALLPTSLNGQGCIHIAFYRVIRAISLVRVALHRRAHRRMNCSIICFAAGATLDEDAAHIRRYQHRLYLFRDWQFLHPRNCGVMGKDKKIKKNKKKDPKDEVDITKLNSKTGLIDRASIENYKSVYAQYKAQNGKEANLKLEEHVETRLRDTVEDQKHKRKRDITSVAAATAAGTVLPFSGIPIMVASTMVQCVGFSAALGLIPIANVRSFQDVNTLASQMTATLQKASSSGMKSAIEAFVIEVLKHAGIGTWLWDEILRDVVIQITHGVITESAWVLTPLFVAPKYYLHRKLIKKMYVALGEKAIIVHKTWVSNHLFLEKPDTTTRSAPASTAVTHELLGPAVDPSAYLSEYYSGTGEPMYESNADDLEGVPYAVYYQPTFAASAHRPPEFSPLYGIEGAVTGVGNPSPHFDSFPNLPQHPYHQYAYYPPSYPMHPVHHQAYPQSGPQHQQFYGPQPYTYEQASYNISNPSSYNPSYNHLTSSHMHSNSEPNLRQLEVPLVGYPLEKRNGEVMPPAESGAVTSSSVQDQDSGSSVF